MTDGCAGGRRRRRRDEPSRGVAAAVMVAAVADPAGRHASCDDAQRMTRPTFQQETAASERRHPPFLLPPAWLPPLLGGSWAPAQGQAQSPRSPSIVYAPPPRAVAARTPTVPQPTAVATACSTGHTSPWHLRVLWRLPGKRIGQQGSGGGTMRAPELLSTARAPFRPVLPAGSSPQAAREGRRRCPGPAPAARHWRRRLAAGGGAPPQPRCGRPRRPARARATACCAGVRW